MLSFFLIYFLRIESARKKEEGNENGEKKGERGEKKIKRSKNTR